MTARATAINQAASTPRLSIPRRGHVLTSIAEFYGEPIRSAAAEIAAGFDRHKLIRSIGVYEKPVGPTVVKRAPAELAAWHLCTQWVVGTALGALDEAASLVDASAWFAGTDANDLGAVAAPKLGERSLAAAMAALRAIAEPPALAELLPYILDPHGPGSRLSVMRDPATQKTRARKRRQGVFYTPADVAEYMTSLALAHLAPCHPVTVLDPACGTGVYLRAVLSALVARHPVADPLTLAEQSLFGVDIDPWAVDAAAYVLLHDVLAHGCQRALAPAAIWRLLRLNLRVADALLLDPVSQCDRGAALNEIDRDRRQVLRSGELPDIAVAPSAAERQPLDHLFRGIGPGPRVVLGNPPYAGLGPRHDLPSLAVRFETLRPATPSADLHPLFIEQMVRLSAPESSGALVVPLSIAFNTRPQYAASRRLVDRTPGIWRFSFFDREPHALFGEEVKTRNAIIAWSHTNEDAGAKIMTGPLFKWRGDSRARMFASIRFTEIRRSIANGIPKLGGWQPAEALKLLEATHARTAALHDRISSSELADCFDARNSTVFVGSTAYNFINVFMRPSARLKPAGEMSTNTIYAMHCRLSSDAQALFALLSSRVAFWLWHTLGDGFHITRAFLEDLPIGAAYASAHDRASLAELGAALWHVVRTQPIPSCNRGRLSLGFSAARCPDIQRRIDQIIINAAKLPTTFADDLDRFVQSVIAADPYGAAEGANPENYYA